MSAELPRLHTRPEWDPPESLHAFDLEGIPDPVPAQSRKVI